MSENPVPPTAPLPAQLAPAAGENPPVAPADAAKPDTAAPVATVPAKPVVKPAVKAPVKPAPPVPPSSAKVAPVEAAPPQFAGPIDFTSRGRDRMHDADQRRRKNRWRIVSALALIIPTLIGWTYWFFLASPQYLASSAFILKSDAPSGIASGLAILGMNLGGSGSTQGGSINENAVITHLLSAEGILELNQKVRLREHYSHREWDAISRLSTRATNDEFIEFARGKLTITYDPISATVKTDVLAFDPKTAQITTQAIAEIAEGLVNRLNQEFTTKRLEHQRRELADREKQLQSIRAEVVRFQNQHRLIDANGQTKAIGAIVAELEGRLSAERSTLAEQQHFLGPNSEPVQRLKARVAALQAEVDQQIARIVGPESGTAARINELAQEQQRLDFQEGLALETYKSAVASLEQSLANLSVNQRQLLVVARASEASDPAYPRIWYYTITLFVLFSLLVFIVRITVLMIYEHRD